MQRAIKTCTTAAGIGLLFMATACSEREADQAAVRPAESPAKVETSGAESPPTTAPATTVVDTGGAERVRERAERLWKAKQTDDWAEVFALRDPSARHDATVEEYVAWATDNEPFKIHGYEMLEVLTEGTMAWVEFNCQMSVRRFPNPPRSVHRWEKWRYVENDGWYPVPKDLDDSYPSSPADRNRVEEDRLRERFMASWDARKTRDWAAYLEFYDPADRPTMTLEKFAEVNEMFIYDACELHWVEVKGGVGRVRVSITERVTDPSLSKMPPQVATATEDWLEVGDEWYIDLLKPQR